MLATVPSTFVRQIQALADLPCCGVFAVLHWTFAVLAQEVQPTFDSSLIHSAGIALQVIFHTHVFIAPQGRDILPQPAAAASPSWLNWT